jgi:hypothetical protein
MNCQDAQKVWKTGNPIEGLKRYFPQVWDFLVTQARCFATKHLGGPFDQQVKAALGSDGDGRYRLAYLDQSELGHQVHDILGDPAIVLFLRKYFTDEYGIAIQMGSICCDGHITGDPDFFCSDDLIKVQIAAIQIEGMKTGD